MGRASGGNVPTPPQDGDAGAGILESKLAKLKDQLFPAWDAAAETEARACVDQRCLFRVRYGRDAQAEAKAFAIFEKVGVAATHERSHTMDGGYRGMVQIIATLPVGAERKHLEFSAQAFAVITQLEAKIRAAQQAASVQKQDSYRFFPAELRFFRTLPKKTPSAYAIDDRIAYNVIGTLMQTQDSVTETMVHEIFHLNDQRHQDWSTKLQPLQDRIIKKCGKDMACLSPYAPGTTVVRGGTYYAFQPGNDAREYAAELMTRLFREVMTPPKKAFKCKTPENAEAHLALVTEFFGVDPAGPCL
jgi:hypothetical protein